ncbi:LytTR family DNA-binding domain-containing protein [Massilia eburnea]|uniref:LytTR family DNA-binding domain-containing protein n=1 Tax=Massilia eburnea TaxID=1776165 RepID=UPI003D6A5CCF
MKPIEPQRLAAALERAAARLGPRADTQRGLHANCSSATESAAGSLRLENIRLFESEGNYTRLYFDGAAPASGALPAANWKQRLDPQQFFRASRRHIVNPGPQ